MHLHNPEFSGSMIVKSPLRLEPSLTAVGYLAIKTTSVVIFTFDVQSFDPLLAGRPNFAEFVVHHINRLYQKVELRWRNK